LPERRLDGPSTISVATDADQGDQHDAELAQPLRPTLVLVRGPCSIHARAGRGRPVTAPSTDVRVAAAVAGVNSGLIAIGTNIRQQAVQLQVTISPGDPAALDRLEEAIRLERARERVVRWGKDFARLVGRDDVVATIRSAVDARQSVAAYGDEKIGKTVLLRHLAPRIGSAFRDGVARIPAAGMLWQDVGQEIVRTFYQSRIPIQLGPAQLDEALRDVDALILLDDVSPDAGIEQLTTMLAAATFVVTSSTRLLAGESRAVRLPGIDPAAVPDLIRHTLVDLGASDAPVDLEAARRIGIALDGHPDRIITAVQRAWERGVDVATLAAELAADPELPAAETVGALTEPQRAVVDAVDALGGAPVGAEHVAAVVPGGTLDQIRELVRGRVLRTASPRVRVDPWLRGMRHPPEDGDAIRARYLEHFVDWAPAHAESADAVADEAQAIVALLDWAEQSDRPEAALALSTATEGPLALAGRWGTWEAVTGHRLRAAERLGLEVEAAVALNQVGVQRLGQDDVSHARRAFEESVARATRAGAPDVADVARRNLEVIDGPLLPPRDERRGRREDRTRRITIPRSLLVLGLSAVILAAVLLLVAPRSGLAIEPATGVFTSAAVDLDGDRSVFTITNRGSGVLQGLEIAIAGDRATEFHVVGGDCVGARLGGGASCRIELLFHPRQPGRGTALLVVTAGDGSTISATIEGVTAAAPPGASSTPPVVTASPTATPSAPPIALPDLAIGRFTPTGPPEGGDFWRVPVEVEIVNAGQAEAAAFPIVVTADGTPVPFQVEGIDEQPLTSRDPLAAGGRLPLVGAVLLDRGTALEQVQLVIEADSCTGEVNAPLGCRIEEAREDNNSLALQAVDIQVLELTIGVPEPGQVGLNDISPASVPVTFELANRGTRDADELWLASYVGQLRPPLVATGFETDPETGAVRIEALPAGASLPISGRVLVPMTSLRSQLVIVAGCAPGVDPCPRPEIALENNFAIGRIPAPPESTLPPTPDDTPPPPSPTEQIPP
jgi:hypothetical protein